MTHDQIFISVLLVLVLGLFAWGKWRYDVVAMSALLAATTAGLVSAPDAFMGFGHPATVTIAMVLIISRGLKNSGIVSYLARYVLPPVSSPSRHVGLMAVVAAALSSFMNNVGALALLMPAALESARKASRSPALILMPLSFASILGGLVTLIGTPPNIIIAGFRADEMGTAFGMFDFTPVGGTIAVAGVLFVSLVGWRLIPENRKPLVGTEDSYHIEDYVAEARVSKSSRAEGETLAQIERLAAEHDATVLALIRRNRRLHRASPETQLRASDILLIEAGSVALDSVFSSLDLKPVGTSRTKKRGLLGDELALAEAVVTPTSTIVGTADLGSRLKRRFGVNLVAVSRQGMPFHGRLKTFRSRPGDVLLLQGAADRLPEAVAGIGCLPLAAPTMPIGRRRFALVATGIFATAIAATVLGFVDFVLAFAIAAVVMVVLGIVSVRELYNSVDWPVIVLVGAMIPVGQAMDDTGTTELIAHSVVGVAADSSPIVTLLLVMILTMMLTNVLNNAATTVVMAPLALAIATELNSNPDSFLMAVAVGASCAFLTPIGHQNNTLVLGPGGYRFGDYWRMGLPLQLLIIVIAVPMLLWIWPL